MSSTKNTKDNRHVVVAQYISETIFKIPDGLDLNDETIVECWGIKWNVLYIKYVGKDKDEEIEGIIEETDYKRPYESYISPAEDACFEYEEDQ